MEMSAQQLTQVLGSLLGRRAGMSGSSMTGALVGVTPGPEDDDRGHMTVVLPGGKAFTVVVTEI